MLTFGRSNLRFCDGISRRSFLALGTFGGLTLAGRLRADAAARSVSGDQPAAASPKAAIMVWLPGGPSHIDMYDLKPDAPAEFRGEFKPICTNVPGLQISEHFPLQARMFDKLAVVRSLVAVDEHSDSYVMTGYPERVNAKARHPSFGSVVSKLRPGRADMPPFVSLRGMSIGTEPGYLGIAHRPFTPDGPGKKNLNLVGSVTPGRLDERKDLLAKFDNARPEVDATGTMRGMDTFTQRAFDMITSGAVRKALDLQREDPRVRDRYTDVEMFLTARRLIEAGVGCVTLSYGGWDTHNGNFKVLKRQLPILDRGISNLVQDLSDRGMLDEVVVVVWGEFGRTPRINSADAGRDHWPAVMSALVAGGGLKTGQAVGTSSPRGEYPKDRPYKVPHLLSTLYRAIGIDPATTFPSETGRPMYLLDERDTVTELI